MKGTQMPQFKNNVLTDAEIEAIEANYTARRMFSPGSNGYGVFITDCGNGLGREVGPPMSWASAVKKRCEMVDEAIHRAAEAKLAGVSK
jgi:hypothetical protein